MSILGKVMRREFGSNRREALVRKSGLRREDNSYIFDLIFCCILSVVVF